MFVPGRLSLDQIGLVCVCFCLAVVSVNIVKLAAGLFTLDAKLAGESVLWNQ